VRNYNKEVKEGNIKLVCLPCADIHSKQPPYADVLTVRKGVCEICGDKTTVGPAYKLFNFYRRMY